MTIYTAGHSTLPAEGFLSLVKDVQVIIDVRSHPVSKKWPQYNMASMEKWLHDAGKEYVWWPNLGGWSELHTGENLLDKGVDVEIYTRGKFPKQRIAASTSGDGPAWTNQGLYDYSWFMARPDFVEAAEHLIVQGRKENVAIVCCECLWYKCHRSMISDYLYYKGVESHHLLGKRSTPHSRFIGNRVERYLPEIRASWDLAL